ncbi:MAG: GNAT family N-acetyltransferase [Clostridia bacterium]
MMTIKDLTKEDKEIFIELCLEFYKTPAALHQIPREFISNTADEAIKGNEFLRCLMLRKDKAVVGYLLLSFTYSNEVGGDVLLLEEIYIRPEFQGQGIGKEVFKFIFETYDDRIKRYRLEVTKENTGATALYERQGFKELCYKQMILERL